MFLNLTLIFVNLFDVLELGQNIRELKKYKALPSITQDEESFDRFGAIDPR